MSQGKDNQLQDPNNAKKVWMIVILHSKTKTNKKRKFLLFVIQRILQFLLLGNNVEFNI
jgi:hypothetical protein